MDTVGTLPPSQVTPTPPEQKSATPLILIICGFLGTIIGVIFAIFVVSAYLYLSQVYQDLELGTPLFNQYIYYFSSFLLIFLTVLELIYGIKLYRQQKKEPITMRQKKISHFLIFTPILIVVLTVPFIFVNLLQPIYEMNINHHTDEKEPISINTPLPTPSVKQELLSYRSNTFGLEFQYPADLNEVFQEDPSIDSETGCKGLLLFGAAESDNVTHISSCDNSENLSIEEFLKNYFTKTYGNSFNPSIMTLKTVQFGNNTVYLPDIQQLTGSFILDPVNKRVLVFTGFAEKDIIFSTLSTFQATN